MERAFIQKHSERTLMPGEATSASSVGTYGLIEAAEYLRIPCSTVFNWTKKNKLILMPTCDRLSFLNLVELHVLKGMRIWHNVPLQRIRSAIDHMRERFGSNHPLAAFKFDTDGIDLFLEQAGSFINVSRHGQLAFKSLLGTYTRRIEWDKSGLANQFFPFVVDETENEPRTIVLNPRISFGRPVIVGTGISTAVIAGRFNARDSVPNLAEEYGLKAEQIEEAIRWESRPKRAA